MSNADPELNRKLQAIADPARRRILQALKERGGCSIGKDTGLCAVDIEQRLQLSQPTISHHMAVLKNTGLVKVQKLGLWMWYQRDETAIREFTRTLRKNL